MPPLLLSVIQLQHRRLNHSPHSVGGVVDVDCVALLAQHIGDVLQLLPAPPGAREQLLGGLHEHPDPGREPLKLVGGQHRL